MTPNGITSTSTRIGHPNLVYLNMKKWYFFIVVLFCIECTPKQETEKMAIPPGLSIRSQFTTRMNSDNLPQDDITYIPPTVAEFTVYSTFQGITAQPHTYKIKIEKADGSGMCDDSPSAFTPQQGTHAVWTKINARACLTDAGEYVIKVYLDGHWVAAKTITVLTEAEMQSGTYEPYWNKDKYVAALPAPASTALGDWQVKTVGTLYNSISNLFVVPHQGFNRIFFVERVDNADEVFIQEFQNYGSIRIATLSGIALNQQNIIRFRVEGDILYYYTPQTAGSYDLNSGAINPNATLPFTPAPDYAFESHNGHVLSQQALLDGKSLISASGYCVRPEVLWASWNPESTRLYYWLECGEGSDYGFYEHELGKPESRKLLAEFHAVQYPVYFTNKGTDFIAYIEKNEDKPSAIKIATRANYAAEVGFGPYFYWDALLSLPVAVEPHGGEYLTIDFYKTPKAYQTYRYALDYMSERSGEIVSIGRVKDGALAGREVYRLLDENAWYEDKGNGTAYPTKEYSYLIRHGSDLILVGLPEEERTEIRFPDLDGKRKKSDLFNGVTRVLHYTNQLIAGVHAPSTLMLPTTTTTLKRMGVVSNPQDQAAYRKLFTDPAEGEIYVKQKDDGSFWRFNGDGTATLYQYAYNFSVHTKEGIELTLQDYVPFTNLDCIGNPLDYACVMIPDPTRLVEIGTTATQEPVYSFATERDDMLQQHYATLKEAYDQAGQSFKSFSEFTKGVPLFLWKDPFGRYVRFLRREYLAPSNCEPILYLYPEAISEVTVTLGDKINVIASRPAAAQSWHLLAHPDGTFVDLPTGKKYDRVFWEGISGYLPPQDKGYVVEACALDKFFDRQLPRLGLTEKETTDFKDAWLKELNEAPYYFIGFYEADVINYYAPMTITPVPQTIIRILMDVEPMQNKIQVEPPHLGIPPVRMGFTVVEWAGLKRHSLKVQGPL